MHILLFSVTVLCCVPTFLSAKELQHQLPVLTAEGGRFIVFDPALNEHSFTQHNDGTLSADANTSGTLVHLGDQQYRWTNLHGQQYRFEGSQFIGQELRTGNHECSPSSPSDTDSIDTPAPNEAIEPSTGDDSEKDKQCDTQTSGAHHFSTPVPATEHTLLDARPESCESYFVQFYGTRRGSEIETGLSQHAPYSHMTPTLRTFPVIDFIDDNALYVVHSRDLGNRTFNSPARPNALLEQLLDDGEEIQTRIVDVLEQQGRITASELGHSTSLTSDQLKPVTLQLIIRDGIASASHWQQIDEARSILKARYGITLEVVVIP